MLLHQIDVGFAAAATVSKALKEKISQLQALEFRKECATVLAVVVSKIQEGEPSSVPLISRQILN